MVEVELSLVDLAEMLEKLRFHSSRFVHELSRQLDPRIRPGRSYFVHPDVCGLNHGLTRCGPPRGG
ncbi:MAG: hypothetical protein ACJ79H_01170 [Myxococcales bacterium]